MTQNLLGPGTEDLIATALGDATGPVLVVNPSSSVVEGVVDAGTALDGDHPPVRLLADERTLKESFEDFILASEAADLLDDGRLELRSTDDLPQTSLVVTEGSVVALVAAGDRVGGIVTDDESFVAAAEGSYGADWETAEEFALRTPAISTVRSTLDDEISPEVREDFDGVLSSLQTARGDGDGLDEVTVSLLVAAKNDVLLYDISKWGEDVGIASKATFSRTKTRLEDMGIIDTEKVPIEVGRPRLRLKLTDERLETAEPGDLASVAQSVLAS